MKTKLAFLTAASLMSAPIFAEIQINGFANLIGGMTLDEDEAVYDYDSDFSFDPASVFGLQVRGDVSDKLSATAQLVGRGSEDYDASFEWAYMTYMVSNNVSVSAGRIRMPLFKYSSSLDVGYSYHWLTPPDAVYGIDFNNIDGVRIDYSTYSGDWEYGAQVTFGHVEADTTISGTEAALELENVMAVSFEATRDWFSARTLLARGTTSAVNEDFDTFVAGMAQFGSIIPSAITAAEGFSVNEDTGVFFEVAVDIDKYDWFVGAEFTKTEVDDAIIASNEAWYITAGMRFGKFTPHITYEVEEADNDDQAALIAALPSTIDTGDATTDATWSSIYQAATGIAADQALDVSAVTLGLRYDVEPGFALKAEVTWYSDDLNDLNDATLLRVGANYTF
ncbi:topoisomerase IV [Alteromonas sp. 1_MG-2023]|uniref:topoisomerase IV n=1 Tax=Alteromonas sp. 1_MG-2023 TaxID=3062669 RepID=UPI0026E1A2E0|nr:topoisomerase IV [Alteromonas sp. 1_MG-2023]MDO6565702.1 topoisomerase IV [Alteromonas sp. 1_MG-2023]